MNTERSNQMPAISKIRFANVIYEAGAKRYTDDTFDYASENGAFLLENGGGKTVFLHTALQAILPHTNLGKRKIKDTLALENTAAHIGIEWLKHSNPKRYVATCITLYLHENELKSLLYVYEYGEDDMNELANIPFTRASGERKRAASKEEINDYYLEMKRANHHANVFDTIKSFQEHIEENHQIIKSEWENIARINGDEGGVEKFFERCETTSALYDRLLIPTVESTIVGHEKGMFANTFEKQREGFHAYRRLKKTLKDNETIEKELQTYVDVYAEYDAKLKEMRSAEEWAKGSFQLVNEELQKKNSQLEKNKQEWDEWQQVERTYKLKETSYKILLVRKKLATLEETYRSQMSNYTTVDLAYNDRQIQFQSLKYARQQEARKTALQHLERLKIDLQNAYQSEEFETLEEKMDIAYRELAGCLFKEKEAIEKQLKELDEELKVLQNNLTTSDEKLDRNKTAYIEYDKTLVRIQTNMKNKQQECSRLEKEVLENTDKQTIKEENKRWIHRLGALEEEIVQLQSREKECQKEIKTLGMTRERLNEDLYETKEAHSTVKRQESELNEAHNELIDALGNVDEKWLIEEDLYVKEQSIRANLQEVFAKASKTLEDSRHSERMSMRYVDDYGKQENFFADTFLKEQLDSWKRQFDYLVTGVEFYTSLPEDQQRQWTRHTLWPLLIITTTEEKQKAEGKVQSIADRLQYPILVMSLDEARAAMNGELTDHWIMPAHWQHNLDEISFKEWQRELEKTADRCVVERERLERQKNKVEQVLIAFDGFFTTYSADRKVEINQQIHDKDQQIKQLERKIDALKGQEIEREKEQETARVAIQTCLAERIDLQNRTEKAQFYFQHSRELTRLQEEERNTQQELVKREKENKALALRRDYFKEQIEEVSDRKEPLKELYVLLTKDKEYKKVAELRPIYTQKVKSVIQQELEDMSFKLRQITQSTDAIQAHIKSETEKAQASERIMKELVQEHPFIIKDQLYPADGDQLLATLQQKLPQLKVERDALSQRVDIIKNEVSSLQGKYEERRAAFATEFSGREEYEFTIEAEVIADMLQQERKNIHRRQVELEKEKASLVADYESIQKAEKIVEQLEYKYGFMKTSMDATPFNEAEKVDFMYNQEKFVKKTARKLEDAAGRAEISKQQVHARKERFNDFLKKWVEDPRLREMAMQGLEHNQTYEELLQFQSNMSNRIHSINEWNIATIRSHDKELQAFITTINNHLLNLVQQLEMIPKKTQLKIEGVAKEVFKFTIPEWKEEDGKTLLRDHLEWIMGKLDSNAEYLNVEGIEDKGKVRKDIEKWLDTKQLLQIVMQREAMKVSCRKVTSDNKVSTRFYPWEQSSKWSGGEQWSKNMTLFLGILDFVADKKRYSDTKMKHRRSVILDNPFGKASSEHVLHPVFFIAEQLGFQIIALTAHAEGKYLEDYFPVIYSCRLRSTDDPSKQIVDKTVQRAYFRDLKVGEFVE